MPTFNWQTEYHRYRRYFTDLGQFYQTKKGRTYAGIILSLLTVAFFIFFAIKPTLITIAQLIRQVKDQKTVARELEKKVKALSEAQSNYLLVESNLPLVDQALPKDPQISILVKQLEALARRSQVTIKSLQISKANLKETTFQKTEKQAVDFSFNVLGDYQNLKIFLSSLSRLRRIISIEAFSFQSGKEETILSLKLNAKTWFLEEK